MDEHQLRLVDLIDVNVLQEIQDGFSQVTGLAALIVDEKGAPVTQGSNFTDFCMKHVRRSEKGCQLCEECDKRGGDITARTGKAVAYVCHAGLMDFAAPITINGLTLGAFIGGQALIEEPDEDNIADIADNIDIDPDELVRAVRRVNIVDRQKIEDSANFLQTISKVLSTMAITNFETNNINSQLVDSISKTERMIREVRNVSDKTTMAVTNMQQRFVELSEMVRTCQESADSCAEVVNTIQDNATTTHILGLNASIEASRAKEEGRGFSIIASEVRTLADISKSSADVIKSKIGQIGDNTTSMTVNAEEVKILIDRCLADMRQLKEILNS